MLIYSIKGQNWWRKMCRLKARIFPHGNRNKMKGDIRKDAARDQFDVIRLLVILVTMLHISLGIVDIKGAYIQSGLIKRKIYIRPPLNWKKSARGTLWKLLKQLYGIIEAGRKWATVIEEYLLTDLKLEKNFSVRNMLVKRNSDGVIIFVMVKLT